MSLVEQIVAAARSQMHVQFSLGRRYDGVALDCVGLLEVVAERCGLVLKAPPGYSARYLLKCDAHQLMVDAGGIPKDGPAEVGDIVRLELRHGLPIHFGIVVGQTMIHACDRRKRVVEDMFENCASVRVRGVYSWPL